MSDARSRRRTSSTAERTVNLAASLIAVGGFLVWLIAKLASWHPHVHSGLLGDTIWEVGLSLVGLAVAVVAVIYWFVLGVGLVAEVVGGKTEPRFIILWLVLAAVTVALFVWGDVKPYEVGGLAISGSICYRLLGPEFDRLTQVLIGEHDVVADNAEESRQPPPHPVSPA